jgi:hypothetical protein
MTLSPNPSVQANRYTYANASPLTHTDPTGHWAVEGNPASGGSGWQDWVPSPGNSIPTAATADPDEGWICGSWGCFRVRDPLYSWGNENVGDGRVAQDNPQWHFINFVLDDTYLGSRAVKPQGYDEASLAAREKYREGYYSGLGVDELASLWQLLTSPPPSGAGMMIPDEPGWANSQACKKKHGRERCDALEKAQKEAKRLKDLQGYAAGCLGDTSGDGVLNIVCQDKHKNLGITDAEMAAMRKAWREGDRTKKWLWNLFSGGLDFLVGDIEDCAAGKASSCALMLVGFLPGAKAGKALAKIFPKNAGRLEKAATTCIRNSFVAGTLVSMADGSRKPIEEILVGDKVLATDPLTGETAAKEVTDLIVSTGAKDLIEITVTHVSAGGEHDPSLTATAEHPFWLPASKQWVNATDLAPGMWLRTSAGTYVQVEAIKQWTAVQRVHNMTIAGLHTYYVAVGGSDVLIHNASPCSLSEAGKGLAKVWGKNRVTITSGDKRYTIDLQGKPHFDKKTGKYIDTPHVKMYYRHVGPNGNGAWRPGDTRLATWQDLRLVRNYFRKTGIQ